MWEWLAGVDLEKMANALVILLTGLAAGFGLTRGKKADPAEKKPAVEVATDFFDAEAIGLLTKEVTGQAVAITGNTLALKDQAAATRELGGQLARFLAMQEAAEEKREEREREALERRAEQLERQVDELRRGGGEHPMRRDQR